MTISVSFRNLSLCEMFSFVIVIIAFIFPWSEKEMYENKYKKKTLGQFEVPVIFLLYMQMAGAFLSES